MEKPKLQIVAVLMTLSSAVCLPGCSAPGANRENDEPSLWVSVECDYAGASADEVASQVSYPIETTLSTIARVENVSSVSRSGRATVWVEFKPGTDLYEARQAVAQRLNTGASSLPDDARPTLPSPTSDETLLIALYASNVPEAAEKRMELGGQLRELAEFLIRQQLLAVSGVSDVSITGGLRKRHEVVAPQARLSALNVTLTDLAAAIEQAHATVAASEVVGNKEFSIRSVSPRKNLEDLANVVVITQGDRIVRVKDVASVKVGWDDEDDLEDGMKAERDPARFSGVVLAIQLGPNTDQQAVSKKIDEALVNLRDDLPSGIKISRSIHLRLDDLVKLTMQKLGRRRPPGWVYQRRSTKQLGDHLVAGKSDRAVVKLIGPELKTLRSKAGELLARLREVPGVTDLQVDPSADLPQLRIEMDREASARLGLSTTRLAEALSLVIGGKVVTQVREGNQMIDVVVESQQTGEGQADIGRHLIRTESGELVPLNQLAKLKVEAVPPVVYSENLQPVVFVSYGVTGQEKSDVQADVQRALDPLKQLLNGSDGNYRIEYRP